MIAKNIKKSYTNKIYSNCNRRNKKRYKNEYILLLKKYINEMSNSKLIAYSIMDNHAHILIYSNDVNEVIKLMRKMNTAYAIYYNKNEDRKGYVFAHRYYSQTIKDREHLFICIKYIHFNPVKAGLVNSQNEYKFSSFRDFTENRLDKEVSKLIFGTEKYEMKLYNFDIYNKYEIIDISEESNKTSVEDLINKFCEEFNVNLNQIKESNNLILEFKEYLNKNFKITNKTICGILGIGKNRIKEIEKNLK